MIYISNLTREKCIMIYDLIKFIPKKMIQYETNLNDDILSIDWHESNLENDD